MKSVFFSRTFLSQIIWSRIFRFSFNPEGSSLCKQNPAVRPYSEPPLWFQYWFHCNTLSPFPYTTRFSDNYFIIFLRFQSFELFSATLIQERPFRLSPALILSSQLSIAVYNILSSFPSTSRFSDLTSLSFFSDSKVLNFSQPL